VARTAAWDRFANWPKLPARLFLGVLAILLVLAALPSFGGSPPSAAAQADKEAAAPSPEWKDDDVELYQAIVRRVAAGEPYYRVATEEQRARDFPVTPGLAVRLPTLAVVSAALGPIGIYLAAALLGIATLLAWWRRMGEEPGGANHRIIAVLLLAIGIASGLKPQYLALHEVWAGTLLALSFALHRGGRWIGSLLIAALALAIREHALPFVLLMGAFAWWNRRWAELAGWAVLTLLFAILLWVHLGMVADYVTSQDRLSPPWLVLRGLEGFTSNVVLSSSLHLLPPVLAAPLALLPLVGWVGWKSPAGGFGTLLYGGYGLLFMLAGRENNFYWALMIVPAYFVGLVFLPMALKSLWRSAKGRSQMSSAL
jgi:hypothetical protein